MKFIPHDYQKVAKDFILDRQAAGLFLDMGLGKTVTTLTAIEELKNDYLEDIKVLVIAPKRVAEDTWTTDCLLYTSVIAEMPDVIEEYIKYELSAVPCELFRAYMPEADSAIKDCIRVFKTQDNQYECGIRNNDFALIEKSDVVEMYIGTNSDTFESEPKVLLIKRFTTDIKDPELVGLILPHKFD